MELKITSIGDKGKLVNERIGFKVLKDCQLKYYLLTKTKKTENGFANRGDAFFWFLPQEVKTNDKVVIYTKYGKNAVKVNNDGTTTYFYYWGLNEPIFNSETDRVVLANINTWKIN